MFVSVQETMLVHEDFGVCIVKHEIFVCNFNFNKKLTLKSYLMRRVIKTNLK